MSNLKLALAGCLLLMVVGASGPVAAAPLSQEDQNEILSPVSGATVGGQVEVIGTVTHPNFDRYSLFYAAGASATGSSQWKPIVLDIRQPVVAGVLGVWDTTARGEDGQPTVPNGVYTLALARYRQGIDTPDLRFVGNITVFNEEVTPTPTQTPLPTAVPGTPTAVPVEMPPTATPLASPTPRPDETPVAAPPDQGGGAVVDLVRLRGAFFEGARIAVSLFALWGLYVFGKAAIRYHLRTRSRPPGTGRTRR